MQDRRGWRDRTRAASALIAGLLLAAGLPAPAGAASRSVEVENVRVGFGERYKVGTWTPVWVQLRGGIEGFNGFLEVVTQDEDGTPTTIRQAVQVGPGGSQRVTAYARTGSLDPDFATLRFLDGKTGRRAADDLAIGTLLGSRPPEPLDGMDYQVVALGRPAGVELVPNLPGYNLNKAAAAAGVAGRAREVAVSRLGAAEDLLPGRWYGFDAVDVVVLDTNDKEMMATLSTPRGEALRQWVGRGGHLVVAVSTNWQAVVDSPIGPMLPARVDGQSQVSPFDSLESFTGGSHQVAFENTPAQVARLGDIEARGGRVIASTLSTPLVVRGPYGFGRVTLIGLDTDTKPFAAWPDRALFWVKALDLKGSGAGVDAQKAAARIISQSTSDLATQVRRALDQFAGVTLVPFGWVAGFIAVYILLIGPGDYFFLKKVLKRMELTWITFPAIVVTVSLLAYYAAYLVKGTDLRVNKMDVVDVDLEARRARGTSWINLFSPQNRDYSIALVPLPIEKDPPAGPGAVAGAPPGTEVLLSWFGAPEAGFRGTNNRSRGMGLGGGGYRYAPLGKPEELEGVRVGIWSTKGFVARWTAPVADPGAILEADLEPVGTDRLAGTVTNRLAVPLKNVIVAFGKEVYYDLGTIEPGASVQVDAPNFHNRSLGNYLQERRGTFTPANTYSNTPENINRADLLREMMFHDSGLPGAETPGQEAIPSRTHRDLDLSGQLALGRPMLVAEVDRPGTQLALGNAPGPAKTAQTTLLRVIMPLKPQAEGESK